MNNENYALPARNGKLVGRKFTEFFFPSVLMSASASLSIIIDSLIVGNVLGSDELGAMNLIMPLSLCFTAISGMFGIGSATLISMFKGKIDNENANKSLTLAALACAVFSVIGVLLGLFANNAVAAFLSGSSGYEDLVAQYLKVYLLGSPFTFIMLIFPHIIKADGQPKLSSNVLIIANAVNLCLDVVYMKFLNMGLAGGALATITGYFVGALLYIIYIKSKSRTLKFAKIKKADFKLYGDMFKMSVSSIFGQGLMFVKIWIFNMIIAREAGQAGLASFSVCTSCLSFVSMFIAGAAQTMMPMVGAFGGADDNTATGFTVKRALKIITLCCVTITILFEIFPNVILRMYGITDGEILQTGIAAVRLFSIALTGIGFSFMFMYYVQASRMPSFSMQICALEGFIIIVPMCLVLSKIFGAAGIWISYTVNEILVALFIFIKSRHIVKKSDGKLYSLFMLKRNNGERIESSIDVSDAEAVDKAVSSIGAYAAENHHDKKQTADAVKNIFALSQLAYKEKTGLKKGDTVDVVISDGKITFKDFGKDYRLIKSEEYIEKIKEINGDYENVLMIGMNYSSIKLA
jgi:Na+-driven multidrug efflux pump